MSVRMNSLFKSLWKRLFNLPKDYWRLNWEAKLGIIFLIPPVIGVFIFIFNLFGAEIGFESFPESWNCISGSDYGSDTDSGAWGGNCAYGYAYGWAYGYAATPAIPLYLGLMAIAGAYLLKGNLNRKKIDLEK